MSHHTFARLRAMLLHQSDQIVFDQGVELLFAFSGQLQRAPLRRLDLRGVKLNGISLRGAILTGTDLRDAKLSDADLRDADLRRAKLSGATLDRANLTGARLEGAYVGNASMRNTIWGAAPGLALLGRRDCFLCGASHDDPCVELQTGRDRPQPHAQRWRPHQLVRLDIGGWRCTCCGGVWLTPGPPTRKWMGLRGLCPNKPLFHDWEDVPDHLMTRGRLGEHGVDADDAPDAFFDRRKGRLPLFDILRLG